MGEGDKLMNFAVSDELKKGVVFEYEYDFGTTTTLKLAVVGERKGKSKRISVLARNKPVEYKCGSCGAKATLVCAQCTFDIDKVVFCNKCAKKHECGEEAMLKIVNSPRTGMCGYEGERF